MPKPKPVSHLVTPHARDAAEIVELLEGLLIRAKHGHFRTMFVVTDMQGESMMERYSAGSVRRSELLGKIVLLQHDVLHAVE
jgi:hypothetical protein